MDNDPAALSSRQHDDLKQVARAIRPDDQESVGVLAGVFICKRMSDRVEHVRIVDAVLARRAVDLHAVESRPVRVASLAAAAGDLALVERSHDLGRLVVAGDSRQGAQEHFAREPGTELEQLAHVDLGVRNPTPCADEQRAAVQSDRVLDLPAVGCQEPECAESMRPCRLGFRVVR